MRYQVLDDDGGPLEAHLDVTGRTIAFHARGGSKTRGTAINFDYGQGLRLILRRVQTAGLGLVGVWVDTLQVRELPEAERRILTSEEAALSPEEQYTLITRRMTKVRRPGTGLAQGGNPTKRIILQIGGAGSSASIARALHLRGATSQSSSRNRLSVARLNQVTPLHVWNAVQALKRGQAHSFGPSRDYDLITEDGDRLPPKAVFGLAASEALEFEVMPEHFTGGVGTPCFKALENAGFTIVPKGTDERELGIPGTPEDRAWTEGKPRLVKHLRRERARGLAQAKRDQFRREHGRLYCESCSVDPIEAYGDNSGEACIEVHHRSTLISEMDTEHETRLEDLECLCASCHRVVHYRLKEEAKRALSTS